MTDRPVKYPARVRVLMLATCSGANAGANSMTTRPVGNSTYRVFSGSNGRQSDGLEAAKTSGILGCLAASVGFDKIISALGIKNLKLAIMDPVLHKTLTGCLGGEMRRISLCLLLMAGLYWAPAHAQYPGGGGVPPITGSGGR